MSSTLDRMITLNRALDSAFSAAPASEQRRVWDPAIDLLEMRDAYEVRADLPGVDRSHIEISLEKNVLTISGQKPASFEGHEQDVRILANERVSGAFSRALRLPEYIDGERIEATHRDGLLTVRIPKAAVAQPRKIEIR